MSRHFVKAIKCEVFITVFCAAIGDIKYIVFTFMEKIFMKLIRSDSGH